MNIKTSKKAYIFFIGTALAIGGLSALISGGGMDFYSEIKTPPLAPPSILFPIVWSVLYILMGISAAMISLNQTSGKQDKKSALSTYAASLIFNFAWSIIFFNLRAFLFAFLWLTVLLYLVIKTIIKYREINKTAAYLQIPYAVWVSFAGYLNFAIWVLN